jgi:hypothetical protein
MVVFGQGKKLIDPYLLSRIPHSCMFATFLGDKEKTFSEVWLLQKQGIGHSVWDYSVFSSLVSSPDRCQSAILRLG